MNLTELFVGALTLRHQTFVALRERSEVFWRGFIVLLIAGLVAGVFGSLQGAIQDVTPIQDKEQVIERAVSGFRARYNGPPELRDMIESYIREGTSMGLEISALPPRAGEGARPIVALVDYIGGVLATPFTFGWMGWTLFAGLLFQFSSRLLGGRASMAQMLGLTSLAAAPHAFSAIVSLLALSDTLGGLGSILGFVIAVWSAVVYVKATAVAQGFSVGRAVAAIAVGFLILIGVCIVVIVILALVVTGLIGAMRG